MFIESIPNRGSPPAILLRESWRDEEGRTHKRTLANLSKVPADLLEGLKALLKGGTVIGTGPGEIEIERSLAHGHVAAVLGMISKIALDRLILSTAKDKASRRSSALIVAMIVDRLIAPRSKLGFVRAVNEETAVSSLGPVLGLGDVKEREPYEALDWLIERQLRIENGLARRHLKDGVLVLYDVSSSYFEGRCCPLAQFGHSRDHRKDRPQIVYGLLCTRAGIPIAVEVFDGNTADPSTLSSQVEKLKDRFGIGRVAVVGDRGMITAARIRDDLKPAGLDWITCLRAPAILALAAESGPLQLSLFDERDLAEISAPQMCSSLYLI
jgi:Transposase DDE domain